MRKLYHKSICWNERFETEYKELFTERMTFSAHMKQHIYEESTPRYNINPYELNNVIKKVIDQNITPFEVEVECDKVIKAVIRTSYNSIKDICIVVREGLVVTAWLNNHNDIHETMDCSKYETQIN